MRREQRRIRGLVEALAAARRNEAAATSHWHQMRAATDRAGRLADSAVLEGVRYRCVRTPDGNAIQTEPAKQGVATDGR